MLFQKYRANKAWFPVDLCPMSPHGRTHREATSLKEAVLLVWWETWGTHNPVTGDHSVTTWVQGTDSAFWIAVCAEGHKKVSFSLTGIQSLRFFWHTVELILQQLLELLCQIWQKFPPKQWGSSAALRLQGAPGATLSRLRAISSTEGVLLLLVSYVGR